MTIEILLAEREIEKQLYRLARAMDNRDWSAMGRVFAPRVVADFGTGEVYGRENVVEFVRSFLDNCGTTQHLLGNILIEVKAEGAISNSYVADVHLGEGSANNLTFRTLGNYCDTWVKAHTGWQIVRRVKDNRATLGSMEVFRSNR